jgi:hypothetical protein
VKEENKTMTKDLTSKEEFNEENIGTYLPEAETDFLKWKSNIETARNFKKKYDEHDDGDRNKVDESCEFLKSKEIFPESLCSDRMSEGASEEDDDVNDAARNLGSYYEVEVKDDEEEEHALPKTFVKWKSTSKDDNKCWWHGKSRLENAIPVNAASFVATVMDRKINLDLVQSQYQLLEAWVDDNPHQTYETKRRKSLLEYSTVNNSIPQRIASRDRDTAHDEKNDEHPIDILAWLKVPSSQRTKRLFPKERRVAYLEKKRNERAILKAKRNQARRDLRIKGIFV